MNHNAPQLAELVGALVLGLGDVLAVIGAVLLSRRMVRNTGELSLAPYSKLPDCCIKCGEPAVDRAPTTFSWSPHGWMSGLFGSLISMATTKRVTIPLPLCERHLNSRPWLVLFLTRIVLLVLIGGGTLGFLALSRIHQVYFGLALLGSGLILAITLSLLLRSVWIQVRRIDGSHATLSNVSQKFIEAYRNSSDQTDEGADSADPDNPFAGLHF